MVFNYLIVVTLLVSYCSAIEILSDNHITSAECSNCENKSSLSTVLKDLEQYKPIKFMNGLSFQVEKTQIPAPSDLDTTSENYVQSRAGRMMPYLTSHALKLDLGVMKFRLGRSDEDADKLEFSIFVTDQKNGVARDKKTAKILLPMIIGFKAATTMVVAIMAVSLLTFKALLAAKVALLVTGVMAIKKLFDSHGGKHGGSGAISAASHVSPYIGNYNLDIPEAAAYHGTSGFDAYGNYGMSGQEAAASDLSSQYSSGQGVLEVVGVNNTAAVIAANKRRDNLRRRPFIAKQHPVFNYRKTLRV